MTSETELLGLFDEVFKRGNLDAFDWLVAPDAIDHNPAPGAAAGRAGMREALRALHAACSKPSVHIEDIVTEGDLVSVRWTMRATHKRRSIAATGTDILKFKNGQVIERWGSCDALGALLQLGIVVPAEGNFILNNEKAPGDAMGALELRRRRIRARIRKYVTQLQPNPSWALLGAA